MTICLSPAMLTMVREDMKAATHGKVFTSLVWGKGLKWFDVIYQQVIITRVMEALKAAMVGNIFTSLVVMC